LSDVDIVDAIGSFHDDPLGFVMFAFPWGKPGFLEHEDGPDRWQIDVLDQIAKGIPTGKAVQVAVSSGHGVGFMVHLYQTELSDCRNG
jgi:hypothetical protein